MPPATSQAPHSVDALEALERINQESRHRLFQNYVQRFPILSETTFSLTSTQRRALAIFAAITVGIALLALINGQAKPQSDVLIAVPQASAAAPVEMSLVVDVQGEVINPGVYQLPAGSRVGDAIKAAGGVQKGSDSSSVNLARFIEDGEQIYVSNVDVIEQGRSGQNSNRIVGQGRLNLNRANESELDGLPGVGPVLAQRIIAYRNEHGNFGAIEDLQKVAGIGPAKFSELRTFVTV